MPKKEIFRVTSAQYESLTRHMHDHHAGVSGLRIFPSSDNLLCLDSRFVPGKG